MKLVLFLLIICIVNSLITKTMLFSIQVWRLPGDTALPKLIMTLRIVSHICHTMHEFMSQLPVGHAVLVSEKE